MQSLANMRVLYRQKVDEYLLEVLEKPEIYAEVARQANARCRAVQFYELGIQAANIPLPGRS